MDNSETKYLNFNAISVKLSLTDQPSFSWIAKDDKAMFDAAAAGQSVSIQLKNEDHGVAIAKTFCDLGKAFSEMNAKKMNGASLKRARKLLRYTQTEMGKEMGLTKVSVCNLERKRFETLPKKTALIVECILRRAKVWGAFAQITD